MRSRTLVENNWSLHGSSIAPIDLAGIPGHSFCFGSYHKTFIQRTTVSAIAFAGGPLPKLRAVEEG